jgi:hypothetical protein
MASIIKGHWQKVFQATNHSLRHHYDMKDLADLVPPAVGLPDIPFCQDDIKISLKRHDSAPGPDGVC